MGSDHPVLLAPIARRSPGLVAALFVLPYLLLALAWAFSNAPGAAPDEPDHLVKALGMARLDIGAAYTGPPLDASAGQLRNRSISRVIDIPAHLAPTGYGCFAFLPDSSAACLPTTAAGTSGLVGVVDPLGAYPPFLYVPIGLLAGLAGSPGGAFLVARVTCALGCALLMWLGAAHLVRWLGRRALLGAFVGFTPIAVFCTAVVSTSGLEICAAFGVACVVVVALRRSDSLSRPGTQFLLAGLGATLMLSRQLGVVSFGLLMVLLVARLGWGFCWDLVRSRRPPLLISVGVLVAAAAAVAYWERTYDHPTMIGSVFSAEAVDAFLGRGYSLVGSGIGTFGWLDTPMPAWFVVVWAGAIVLLLGAAVVVGRPADRWTLLGWLAAMVVIGYVTYATVFYPVVADLQGRHLMAFFMVAPVLAGVVVTERLDPLLWRRAVGVLTGLLPVLQVVALYLNARRYAVGVSGPLWFLGSSQWRPVLGWVPWLLLGLVAAWLLARSIWSIGMSADRESGPHQARKPAHVER